MILKYELNYCREAIDCKDFQTMGRRVSLGYKAKHDWKILRNKLPDFMIVNFKGTTINQD